MAEWEQRNPHKSGGSIGSYGFALQALSEGLQNAVRNGWMSEEEAKAEFRSHVKSLRVARDRKIQARLLQEQVDELEADEDIPY